MRLHRISTLSAGLPALAFLLTPQTRAASSEDLHLVVLEPEFKAFWQAAAGQPLARQMEIWDEQVERPHQSFYDSFVWEKPGNPKWLERKRRLLGKMFAQYPALYPAIVANFERFPGTLRTQIARFRQSFPDAEFTLPIYAAPVACFNGKGDEGGGSDGRGGMVLAFGIDVITARADNPDILYAHELFHIYHAGAAGLSPQVFAAEGKLTLPLWMEGFATYVSGLLNRAESDGAILMDDALGRVDRKELPWLAAEFLKVADEKAVNDKNPAAYAHWFGANAPKLRPDLPNRCGCWLGLAVVHELARTHRLDEMVPGGWTRFAAASSRCCRKSPNRN